MKITVLNGSSKGSIDHRIGDEISRTRLFPLNNDTLLFTLALVGNK